MLPPTRGRTHQKKSVISLKCLKMNTRVNENAAEMLQSNRETDGSYYKEES